MLQEVTYIDLNPRPSQNSYGDLLTDKAAIIVGSIANLLQCWHGDRGRIGRPEYSSRLHHLLQEPVDERTAAIIQLSLIQSIQKHEPRIRLIEQRTGVVPQPKLPGYLVIVSFNIIGLRGTHTGQYQVQAGG